MNVRLPGLLAADLTETARLHPTAASLTLKMVGAGEASLTLPEDAPAVHVHDWISLYTQKGFAGVYRVSNVAQNYKKQIDVTLLHGIDILADSVWAAQTDFSGTMTEFLTGLLNQQTHLVNGVKPWTLGSCDDTGTVEKTINYDRLSSLLEGLEEEGSDYYFIYDQTVWPWTVSYKAKPSGVSSEFRLTRNVRGASVTYNDADLCTRLILSVNTGTSDTSTVTIRTYDNTTAQGSWGVVVKTADIDTGDTPPGTNTPGSWTEADAWAANFLAQRAEPTVQIQIDGEELSWLTGDSWDEFSVGKLVRVALPDYGKTFSERAVSVTYPDLLKTPARVTVSLANALPRFSESIASAQQVAAAAARASRANARTAEKQEKEITHWSQKVSYQGAALDGTGVTTLYESGIDMDATGGVKVYSLVQGLQALYSAITVNAGLISMQSDKIEMIATQSGTVTEVFDPMKTYAVGDKVSYEGVAYKFIAAHAGTEQDPLPWDPAHVTAIGSLQSQITQEADKISLVVGQNGINAGAIILALNKTKDGQSESTAEITADLIKLNGSSTTINDKFKIENNKLAIYDASVLVKGSSHDIGLTDGIVSGYGYTVQNGGSLAFIAGTGQSAETYSITASKAANLITDLQLTLNSSTNIYTLQKKTVYNNSWADVGTFSRATSLSGVWSGRYYTVTASPQNETKTGIVYDGLVQTGSVTKSGKNVSRDYIVYSDDGEGDADQIIMQKTVTIPASVVYDDGWGAAYSLVSWPSAQTANAYMDVSAPGSTVDGSAVTKRYRVRSTQNDAYISILNDNETWTDFAHVYHGQYTAGQNSVSAALASASVPSGTTPTQLTSGGSYALNITKGGTTTASAYYTVPASASIASMTLTPKNSQSDPSSNVNPGGITITALDAGSNVLGSADFDLYMTQGSWNSSNKKAVNIRKDDSSGALIARLWIDAPSLTWNCGSISGYSSSQSYDYNRTITTGYKYWTFTVSCGGQSRKIQITVSS